MKTWFNHILLIIKLWIGRFGRTIDTVCHSIILAVSITALVLMAFEVGFGLEQATIEQFFEYYLWILTFFLLAYTLRIVFHYHDFYREKAVYFECFIYVLLLVVVYSRHYPHMHFLGLPTTWMQNDVLVYVLTSVISLIEVSKSMFGTMQRALNPSLLFTYSFLFFILLGTALLMLPKSSVQEGSLRFLDALFTSASAVCITGLSVIDYATELTLMGKIVLLVLVQVGAIGVMTFTSFFAMSFMGSSSFHNQMMLKDLLSEDQLSAIFQTIFRILMVTFTAELLGAVFIFFSIRNTLGLSILDDIWYSVFHSISSFCNSGISLFPQNLQNPLVSHNYALQTCVALLVVMGGLGFPILFNYGKLFRHTVHNLISRWMGRQHRYQHTRILTINTRLSIVTTLCLIVVGWGLYYFFENHNTLEGLSWGEKIAASFFGAVMPRAAGFNTLDMTTMMPATLLLTMFLMWVGASPMSTGGGIKTTTLGLAVLNAFNMAGGKHRLEIGSREISPHSIRRAFAVIMLSIILIAIVSLTLAYLEPDIPLMSLIFESVSVLSTTGLSLNVTPLLCDASRIVLIVSMFIGRVGALTLLIGFVRKKSSVMYAYPTESVMVG